MKAFTKGLAIALASVVAVLGIIALLGSTVLKDSPLTAAIESITDGAGNAAANAALDATGVKEKAEAALRGNVSSIAGATGLSESQVESAIDRLDISSWEVTSLPDGARAQGSTDVSYQGVDATLTTYADPSYVTVEALGQSITLAVPESAQGYVSLLGYL